MAKNLNKEEFVDLIKGSEVPVLIDFWAPWCGPCKMIGPTIEKISEEYAGKLAVGKVNVDEEGDLAMQYGVSSIPTIALFVNGEVKAHQLGAVPKEILEKMFKDYI
ncbi:MAG: thioredoxin [Spirochaetales bacterium]|nr:thioredoxin [Spirochaetales bacterium]